MLRNLIRPIIGSATAAALVTGMTVGTGAIAASASNPNTAGPTSGHSPGAAARMSAVTMTASLTRIQPGTPVTFKGTLPTSSTQRAVQLQKLVDDDWLAVRTIYTTGGSYSISTTPKRYREERYRIADANRLGPELTVVATRSVLAGGTRLYGGDLLQSNNGSYRLIVNDDGNVTISNRSGVAVWSSKTSGNPGSRLVQQYRGSLVLVAPSGKVTMTSGTTASTGAYTQLTDTGKLQVVRNGKVFWTNTSPTTSPTPTPTPTPKPTPKPTPTPTPAPKPTPTPTPAPKPTPTPTPAPKPTPTPTPPPAPKPPPTEPSGPLSFGSWMRNAGPAEAKRSYGYPYQSPSMCTGGGKCVPDKWNFYQGQCTSWVAFRLNQLNGIKFWNYWKGVHWGNASRWGNVAKGIKMAVDQKPARGSVAWWKRGHVGYVERVNSSQSVVISEMNIDNRNAFRVSTMTVFSSKWPDGFIHMADR